MMTLVKRFLISVVLGLLFFSSVSAQNPDTTLYKIEWKENTMIVIEGVQQEVLTFRNAAHIQSSNYLPQFRVEVKGKHLSEVEIVEGNWVDLQEEEQKFLLNPNFVLADCKISINNSTERKRPIVYIGIVPFRRNASSGKIEKLLSFRIKYIESSNFGISPSNSQFRIAAATKSVLSQGEWYKLGFDKSGIYKIDYAFVQKMGLRPENVNPANIQIWGNGGGMLPELCSAARPIDLTQNAIQVVGGEDGRFDSQDYVLFYVQGPNTWRRNNGEPFFRHQNNIYSKSSFYFLTFSNLGNKSIPTISSSNPVARITTNSRREVHEVDSKNFLMSGRKWYGEEFGNGSSQIFVFPSTGLSDATNIFLQSSLMNKSTDKDASIFTGSVNGTVVGEWSIAGSGSGNYIRIGQEIDVLDSLSASPFVGSRELRVNYQLDKSRSPSGSGFLNFFVVNFTEQLRYENAPLFFRNISSLAYGAASLAYVVAKNTSNSLRIWDITHSADVKELAATNIATECSFVADGDAVLREFVAFSGTAFPSPISIDKIENQDIRGASTPDFLIVTHPLFLSQAQRLADFRRGNDKLDVLVVTTDQVYNEFSSGAQDLVAIRDCARMFYMRNDAKFSNLLLFGGASYDYKNLSNASTVTSFVPVYESVNSLDPIYSYSSDDFVGLLDDNEGLWTSDEAMDVGVGRLPARTLRDASAVVSKIINYSSSVSNLGNWRQKLTYVADNGETNNEFLKNAEVLSKKVAGIDSRYNVNKVYISSYNKVILPDGIAVPEANVDFLKAINDGSFIVNYIGHGSETQLASENILNIGIIQALENKYLPFIVTATCDFGRYDAPSILSGGELFLLLPNGGAIGLLTTTRPVYQSGNEVINNAFHDFVFDKEQNLGEILRRCKNQSASELNRNFALLGDPSLTLAYPKNDVVLTKINGKDLVSFADTLKAQSKVTFAGEVRDGSGAKMTRLNGVVDIVIYDKGIKVNTLEEPIISFGVVNKKIFDGSATVKEGAFSFTFIVSKDINYRVDLGRISLYANAEDGTLVDAGGFFDNIYIGSGAKNVPIDNTPPVIKSFINDETFVQGGITNQNPLLLVKLYDESGISSVGGIGNSIMATLVHENSQQQFVLDSYFKTDRDSYQSGTIKYRLTDLKEGGYLLRVNASDANKNNVSGGELEFNVINGSKLSLNKILNYPNPFTTNTTFHFDHNRAGDDLEVSLQIFTVTGKLVKTLSKFESSSNTHIGDMNWDGKDEYGDNIGRGVYVYKLSVKALSDGAKKEEFQKLVILN